MGDTADYLRVSYEMGLCDEEGMFMDDGSDDDNEIMSEIMASIEEYKTANPDFVWPEGLLDYIRACVEPYVEDL